MSGRGEQKDPFAGYRPVKSRVADVNAAVPELPTERPSGGRAIRRNASRKDKFTTLKLIGWLLVSAVLVAIVAAVAFGFFYESTVEERAPELASCSEELDPLARYGRRVRELTRSVLPTGLLAQAQARLAATNGCSLGRMFPVVTNLVKKSEKAKVRPDEEMSPEPASPEAATPAAPEPPRRTVDPRLKTLWNGRRNKKPIR